MRRLTSTAIVTLPLADRKLSTVGSKLTKERDELVAKDRGVKRSSPRCTDGLAPRDGQRAERAVPISH